MEKSLKLMATREWGPCEPNFRVWGSVVPPTPLSYKAVGMSVACNRLHMPCSKEIPGNRFCGVAYIIHFWTYLIYLSLSSLWYSVRLDLILVSVEQLVLKERNDDSVHRRIPPMVLVRLRESSILILHIIVD